jgi:hypothetical protein
MAPRHDFWTHGVATVVELPQLAKLRVHCGIGTFVEQDAGTSGWFHIPIPTPSILDEGQTYFRYFALVASVNANATIDILHLRRGADLVFSKSVAFTNTRVNQVFDNPDVHTAAGASTGAGMTLCVHVTFLDGTPRGRVEFYGAGAAFSQRACRRPDGSACEEGAPVAAGARGR